MKNKVRNILVFPGGTEIAAEIQKSLRFKKEVKLFSASTKGKNHSEFLFSNNTWVDSVYNDNWLDQLNELILEEEIDFLFPANAIVIDALIARRKELKAEVLLPDSEVVKITRSKSKTYQLFEDILPIPKTFDSPNNVNEYPVFSKPKSGYGSQGAEKIINHGALTSVDFDKNIISEYLPGEEYSVDCFSNSLGELMFCQGRTRERIRMGTSMHSEIVDEDTNHFFNQIAKKILSRLKIVGAWFFQMKRDTKGDFKLLEIEIRIAGTMALNRSRGVNFPFLQIMEFSGMNSSILINNYKTIIDRSLVNRYSIDIEYDKVYVDLDDTIIVHNKVNTQLISFLYQSIGEGKKIILITKSLAKDLNEFLSKWRLKQLFDEIIWLKEEDKKVLYIDKNMSIFIDDSFSQRLEVSEQLKIPTFDPSMVEVLIKEIA